MESRKSTHFRVLTERASERLRKSIQDTLDQYERSCRQSGR